MRLLSRLFFIGLVLLTYGLVMSKINCFKESYNSVDYNDWCEKAEVRLKSRTKNYSIAFLQDSARYNFKKEISFNIAGCKFTAYSHNVRIDKDGPHMCFVGDGLLFDFPLYIDVNDNAVIALNKKRTYQRVLCKKAIFEKAQGGFSSDLSIELEDRFSGFSARIYNVEIYDTIKTYAKSGFNSLIYIVVGVGAFFVFSLLVSLSACLYFYYSKTNSRANAVVIKPSKPQISKKDSSNTVQLPLKDELVDV